MRTRHIAPILVGLAIGTLLAGSAAAAAEAKVGDGFKVHTLNAESRFEAAGILDVNRDGKLDIYCGGFWYEAPTWTKHFVREIKEEGEYHYDFANLPMDVDGDGWTDTVGAAWHDKMVYWVRNPGQAGGPWTLHQVDTPGNMETAIAYDINGDGQIDILPNIMSAAAWYEFCRDASAPQGVRWDKHVLPQEAAGHGLGAGDINVDGLCDIVTPKGWLQQNPDGSWTWRAEFELGYAGIPILVHDVDADGDSDLIWGLGHDYGVFWLEQKKDAQGTRMWEKHLIDNSWSQAHFMLLADLDDDRRLELVTGKRHRAHNGHDPGGNDPVCVYYYDFDIASGKWTRHTMHEGGRVGFGINTAAADIDSDGDIDVVAPGKSGLYLFENLIK
ncbi:MAG TPA: VCBS repeat-containing protein [Sedimentisphaerales bacterium]|nr:VCBS repeat-containing protein [Sedimentisphaerales bacterium]HRS09465.1 VCBS repeat-containing protein [Sedimentisphaerales bacterium]HRV46162.1 VCBS repeat-containing protein [Sedimentisphaerales bacterium]